MSLNLLADSPASGVDPASARAVRARDAPGGVTLRHEPTRSVPARARSDFTRGEPRIEWESQQGRFDGGHPSRRIPAAGDPRCSSLVSVPLGREGSR